MTPPCHGFIKIQRGDTSANELFQLGGQPAECVGALHLSLLCSLRHSTCPLWASSRVEMVNFMVTPVLKAVSNPSLTAHKGRAGRHTLQQLPGRDQTSRQECFCNDAIYSLLGFRTKPQKQKTTYFTTPRGFSTRMVCANRRQLHPNRDFSLHPARQASALDTPFVCCKAQAVTLNRLPRTETSTEHISPPPRTNGNAKVI